MKTESVIFSNKKLIIILWLFGMVGVVSVLPVIPQLLTSQNQEPSMPMALIQSLAMLQSGVLIFGAVVLGVAFSHRVNLSAPVVQALASGGPIISHLKLQILPALVGGVLGGLILLAITNGFSAYLPSEFVGAAKNFSPPWYARIFYGGIAEEILMRWGLMSFVAWASYRIFQGGNIPIHKSNYIIAIVLCAILFGVGASSGGICTITCCKYAACFLYNSR